VATRFDSRRRDGLALRGWQLFLPTLILASGCGGNEPAVVSHYEPDKARVALVAALDAWKKGEAAKLARATPPIRFVDDDFTTGMRLSDYELEEPDAPIGLHTNVPVILSLRDKRGRTIRREAHYQVATEPGLAVLRSDP
jgi:hypothetical protein